MLSWTKKEERAIRALEKLASTWPESLTLFSASGTLHILRTEDYQGQEFIEDRAHVVHGILNDGGDPNWTMTDGRPLSILDSD